MDEHTKGEKPYIVDSRLYYLATQEHKKEFEQLQSSHDDLLAACEKAQFVYDYVICRTPTGPERNKLTERNILRLQAIANAKVKESK